MVCKTINGILALLLFIAGTSCKEIFYPEIQTDERIPVIQGLIQRDRPPEVSLTWATLYDSSGFSYIDDAIVWISDDMGNAEYLELTAAGTYTPENIHFKGILYRTYILHVEMATGEVYESTPEKILPAPQIDSLYAEPVEKTEYGLNAFEDLIILEKKGLDIKVDLASNSDSTCYYRFKTGLYTQMSYVRYPNDPRPAQVYLWTSTILDKLWSAGFSSSAGAGQILTQHNPGFLEYVYDPSQAGARTPTLIDGWVISMHVYSISENAYKFYNFASMQLQAGQRIFSPPPAQVKGNISCVNNEHGKVIGLFEACAETVSYKAFKWRNLEEYRSFALDTFPQDIGSGDTINYRPEFWVEF